MKKVLTLVAASLMFIVGFAATAVAGSDRTTICHATGSSSNPYVEITVSNSALDAHRHHQGHQDIIPAPHSGCPGKPHDIPPTQTVTNTVTETVTNTVTLPERVVEKPVTVIKTVVKWRTRTVVKVRWRTKVVRVKTKCVPAKPKGCEGACEKLSEGMRG